MSLLTTVDVSDVSLQDMMCSHAFYEEVGSLLAHLSRRLKGELIVYRSIRRPCVRPCVCA